QIPSGPDDAPEYDRRIEPPVDKGGLKRHSPRGGQNHSGHPSPGNRWEGLSGPASGVRRAEILCSFPGHGQEAPARPTYPGNTSQPAPTPIAAAQRAKTVLPTPPRRQNIYPPFARYRP